MPDSRIKNRLALAGLAAALFLAGCNKGSTTKEAAEQEAPTPVTVEPAVRGAIDHVVTADAVLYPINQANVTPKISAPVSRILVNRGDHVRAGQLLAELESADLAAAAEESKHQYEQTQAASANPDRRHRRRRSRQSRVRRASPRSRRSTPRKKLYDNRVALQREGALAQKLVDDAKVALVQAQSQYDSRAAAPAGAQPSQPARSHSRRAGAGERRESALRQRDCAAFLRRKFAAPSTASSRTARSIPAKCRPADRRWFPSSIFRRWWRAPMSR